MGEEHLGDMNISWGERAGWDILMKAIMNDYWADCPRDVGAWPREKVDIVMSKLYYCWCRMLFEKHPVTEQEEWVDALEEDE